MFIFVKDIKPFQIHYCAKGEAQTNINYWSGGIPRLSPL